MGGSHSPLRQIEGSEGVFPFVFPFHQPQEESEFPLLHLLPRVENSRKFYRLSFLLKA